MKALKIGLGFMLVVQLVLADGGHHDHDDDENTNGKTRLCPDGYFYAGDEDHEELQQFRFMEEIDRSPVYSCYKILPDQETWVSGNMKCVDERAQLVSFEFSQELARFRKAYKHISGIPPTFEIFTSAIHFGDDFYENWMWVGSNSSVREQVLPEIRFDDNETESSNQCLVLHFNDANATTTYIKTANCMDKKYIACEARVRTVTYYTWFVANWFTFLLIFLLIVLVLSLCISMTMQNKRQARTRVYRGHSRQMVNDLPPSYNETTRGATTQASMLDHYRSKGREILAKVYFYKDDKKQVPRA